MRVEYAEGVFIGYRWHDAKGLAPLFPVDHGLGYARFEIGATKVSLSRYASAKRRPCGWRCQTSARAEVVQLYVENVPASVPRPPRELNGFAKLRLAPSETGVAELTLTSGDFVFRDEASAGWKIEPVEFVLRSGLSSRHLSPGGPVKVQAEAEGRMTIFTTGRGLVGAARWSLSFESDDFHVEAEEAARALVVRPSAPDLHAVWTLLEEVVSDTCRGP